MRRQSRTVSATFVFDKIDFANHKIYSLNYWIIKTTQLLIQCQSLNYTSRKDKLLQRNVLDRLLRRKSKLHQGYYAIDRYKKSYNDLGKDLVVWLNPGQMENLKGNVIQTSLLELRSFIISRHLCQSIQISLSVALRYLIGFAVIAKLITSMPFVGLYGDSRVRSDFQRLDNGHMHSYSSSRRDLPASS